jgi:hypothetical protein
LQVLDPLDPVQEIVIQGAVRRGRAFDKDTVVVEVLGEGGEGVGVTGQVVGVLQRAVDHRCRSLVCFAQPSSTGLLTPINPTFPRIHNVLLPKHVQRVRKGFVCVYRLEADSTLTFSHYEKVGALECKCKMFS